MTVQGHCIPACSAAGATQMALDSWMLDQVVSQGSGPILRFYHWSPVAISLGYHQQKWPEHWSNLIWQGQPVELVRRPTGGRAVLHQGDLTYAIALPLIGSRQTAYQAICGALIEACRHFGVTLSYGTAGSSYRHQANCFALATPADLVTESGYKLIGSAQLRRDHYVLQHGSIRLWPNRELYKTVFGGTSDLEQSTLNNIPKQPNDAFLAELQTVIQQALTQQLNIQFSPQLLSDMELDYVEQRSTEFATPANSSPKPAA